MKFLYQFIWNSFLYTLDKLIQLFKKDFVNYYCILLISHQISTMDYYDCFYSTRHKQQLIVSTYVILTIVLTFALITQHELIAVNRTNRGGKRKQRSIETVIGHRPCKKQQNRLPSVLKTIKTTQNNPNAMCFEHCPPPNDPPPIHPSPSPMPTSTPTSQLKIQTSQHIRTNIEENVDIFKELRLTRKKNSHYFRISHLNINSLRNKHDEIQPILSDNLTDLLIVSETKIDSTFQDNLYEEDGFKLERRDRNANGGGLAAWMRSDIAARRRKDMEPSELEVILYEVKFEEGRKWMIVAMYRPPSMKNELFIENFTKLMEKVTEKYENYLIIGDLNYDLLKLETGKTLEDLCDAYDLDNVMLKPTCFKKDCNPSLIDVILTNNTEQCFKPLNFSTGISDCHNLISISLKAKMPVMKQTETKYRTFRTFDIITYQHDIENIGISDCLETNNVNELYENFERKLLDIADRHAPIKSRPKRKKSIPYMNSTLRKAIYQKSMLRNKYLKEKNENAWNVFKSQRNYVTDLKRKSIQRYFLDRCIGGQRSKDFWPTVKPFLSKKCGNGHQKIVLENNSKIVNKTSEVCNIFNEFFVNVANDIGKDNIFDEGTHPSIKAIKENREDVFDFEFHDVDVESIRKIITKINRNKATGVDTFSATLLKAGGTALCNSIAVLINLSIETCTFPDRLKQAQVVPLFKKNDPLDVTNYRPVSILPMISKVFENIMSEQLTEYFDRIFHDYLCAFRKGHGCQTTLLRLIEDWKSALDKNHFVAAILMDLSKAFDCLPHNILLSKLRAYGLTQNAVKLIENYLTNRKQQIRLEDTVSEWAVMKKGVPQGSILGPLLFNIFINDIFYFIKSGKLYNYADDNTLSFSNANYDILISTLETECSILLNWFKINSMKANPDKFQAIAVGKKTLEKNPQFKIELSNISCEEVVKLLGIDLDYQLKFDQHVKNLCRKASQQLNVLKRLGKYLNKLNKLTIFHTFIISNFNFCPLAWHFCSKANTNKLEKVQERALRFIYEDNNSSYETLLTIAKVPCLQIRRMRTAALETFKILYKIAPSCLHDLVNFKNNRYSFRYSNLVDIPRVRTTTYGKHSFRYAAAVLWNDLPENIRAASNFNVFKNLISSWNGKNCKCCACR